jgi:threonine dehydrogenase-like Zn-dependent dehydrogenase
MKAVVFDGSILKLEEIDTPTPRSGETIIKVKKTGICNTDIEITKGYMDGFRGVPGHEFFGIIHDSCLHIDKNKRVTAEINCGCGNCGLCKGGDERHCLNRTVIGIAGRNGVFAEYIRVPDRNVIVIPDEISDTNAIFIEPLAAALEILEQIPITQDLTVALIGDGKLGQLIAHVIQATGCDFTVIGKHHDKLKYLKALGIRTRVITDTNSKIYDIVIDASGSPDGFNAALSMVRPKGTLVLKSTYAGGISFNPAPIVINELHVLGSRCGRFQPAIKFLTDTNPDFSYLVEKEYSLDNALEAFRQACIKGTKKIVIDMK